MRSGSYWVGCAMLTAPSRTRPIYGRSGFVRFYGHCGVCGCGFAPLWRPSITTPNPRQSFPGGSGVWPALVERFGGLVVHFEVGGQARMSGQVEGADQPRGAGGVDSGDRVVVETARDVHVPGGRERLGEQVAVVGDRVALGENRAQYP